MMLARQRNIILILFLISLVLLVYILKFDLGLREKAKTGEENSPPYEIEVVPEKIVPDAGVEEINCEQSNAGEELFLGIYGERIAVYSRFPNGEVILKEVLPYPVQSVYYNELTRGIPFHNQEEKLLLLENLTS
jgi:hypothetical protein